jgi:hypothetical protein
MCDEMDDDAVTTIYIYIYISFVEFSFLARSGGSKGQSYMTRVGCCCCCCCSKKKKKKVLRKGLCSFTRNSKAVCTLRC